MFHPDEVTDAQIRMMKEQAEAAGDLQQAYLCGLALAGDWGARRACVAERPARPDASLKRPGVFAMASAIASRLLGFGRGSAWAMPVRSATPLTVEAMRQGVVAADPHASPVGTYAMELSNGAQLSLTADRRTTEPELVLLPGGKP